MAISALFLAPGAVRADILDQPEPPPQVMVIKGTLSWAANHWWNIERKRLDLTTGSETIHLGPAGRIKETNTGNPIVPETFIGKQVAVTLIGKWPTERPQEFILREMMHKPHPPLKIKKVISLTLVKRHDTGK